MEGGGEGTAAISSLFGHLGGFGVFPIHTTMKEVVKNELGGNIDKNTTHTMN